MSEELRAAKMLVNAEPFSASVELTEAGRLLARHHIQRLAADEDEAAERAKPIDREWLLVIGFRESELKSRYSNRMMRSITLSCGPTGQGSCIAQGEDIVMLGTLDTRGDLIDLIRALKGGAS